MDTKFWRKRTREGRVVYDRKKHKFKGADALRLGWAIRPLSRFDAGLAACLIPILSAGIADAIGIPGTGLEVFTMPEKLHALMIEASQTKWATYFQHNWPLRAAELTIIIESWRAYLAIATIKEITPDIIP